MRARYGLRYPFGLGAGIEIKNSRGNRQGDRRGYGKKDRSFFEDKNHTVITIPEKCGNANSEGSNRIDPQPAQQEGGGGAFLSDSQQAAAFLSSHFDSPQHFFLSSHFLSPQSLSLQALAQASLSLSQQGFSQAFLPSAQHAATAQQQSSFSIQQHASAFTSSAEQHAALSPAAIERAKKELARIKNRERSDSGDIKFIAYKMT